MKTIITMLVIALSMFSCSPDEPVVQQSPISLGSTQSPDVSSGGEAGACWEIHEMVGDEINSLMISNISPGEEPVMCEEETLICN